ncbi:hypothetical protein HMPREF1508_0628 [Shuttleworthella sp. MSX8B]|nr:hypothetical protein HMPREF1508_0628 [Shuttleworthia sp. MSX8B]
MGLFGPSEEEKKNRNKAKLIHNIDSGEYALINRGFFIFLWGFADL